MPNTILEVDTYIEKSAEFAQPILRKLRTLIRRACPEIREVIKWSSPFFEYKGIVGSMTGFKHHVSYGFWKAGLMRDPERILGKAGSGEMATLKAKTVDDLPSDQILLGYFEEAVELNNRGVNVPRPRRSKVRGDLEPTAYFMAAVRRNDRALATFEGFSPSNRKDYVEWVTEAKRESTRDRRLETAVERMAEGKPRNWKYMKDWR